MVLTKKRMWWWVIGRHKNKPLLIGAYNDEQEADDKGWSFFKEEPYEKYMLPTKDRARATSMLKYKLLEQTEDIDYSTQKFQHRQPTEG